ncbi:preprotein translocase subunit SecG [Paracoccus alkanivorans]|uniref:Protein-export membrane protein SecG n=1 Tax=Paracoccus alkanivorans TaxID=2116655 RepID=A0A3M0MJ26_9RHOB|nr:preprotein translocase subunit SecG [Paracoccus alkanivorans]RMC37776.1 preprotein translocase subunit SecG [Paracoccus alkanivorans]
MQNVVLTIHLILAVLLTGVVLLQRSEGGGLGMGGGGGGGVMSGRQAANAMTRLTWIFGVALFVTSISLTIIAARQSSNSSIMDQLGVPESQQQDSNLPQLPEYTPPPSTGGDPLTPPAPDAPAASGEAAGADSAEAPATVTPPATGGAETEAPAASEEVVTPPATESTTSETTEPAANNADTAAPEGDEAAGSENPRNSN